MGIYIPNMSKPKFCKCDEYNCFAWDDEKYKCKITEWKKPCPLIEVVTCGECKHYGFKETDRGGFPCCTNVIGATPYRMPTDFCSYGERRAE